MLVYSEKSISHADLIKYVLLIFYIIFADIIFLIVYAGFKIHLGEEASFGITSYLIFLPLLILQSALPGDRFFNVRYHSEISGLRKLVTCHNFLCHVSPIIYPLGNSRKIKWYNGATFFIVESYRLMFLGKGCFSRTAICCDYYRHHSIVWNHTVQQSSKTTSIIYKENSSMDQPIIEEII